MTIYERTTHGDEPVTRVLIFNFFAGVIDRGIPQYAQDIAECMRRSGYDVIELRCPRLLLRKPRAIRNLFFVLYEQLVAPLLRALCRCSVIVYPYNSVGLIDALLGRSVLIVHDLMPNSRRNTALAAHYIRLTQAAQRALGRPICAASEHTFTQLRRLSAFRSSPLYLWSNPFYLFEHALAQHEFPVSPGTAEQPHVLLCSGLSPNKGYAGAIRLFAHSRRLRNARLRVIGFGDDAYLARRRVARLPEQVRKRIEILPRLSMEEVAAEYLNSDLVWVHSENEGFGRSVYEARLSGRPVLASNIPAFARFRLPGVRLYRDATFEADVTEALAQHLPPSCLNVCQYHADTEKNVHQAISSVRASLNGRRSNRSKRNRPLLDK